MSHRNEEISNEKQGRVEVNDLPRQQEELKDGEARDVKGGGGAAGAGGDVKNKNQGLPISN